MFEHLTDENLINFGARQLSPPETSAAARHLENCEVCRRNLRKILPHLDTIQTAVRLDFRLDAEAEFHLDYDLHLRPFVDEQADAATREIVEAHVEDCAECAFAVRDLREFRESLLFSQTRKAAKTKIVRKRFGWLIPIFAALIITAAVSLIWLATRRGINENAPLTAKIVPIVETNLNPALSAGETLLPENPINQNVAVPPSKSKDGVTENKPISPPKLKFPAYLASLKISDGSLRGAADDEIKIQIIAPPAESVRELRPVLRWRTNGAARFQVKIYDGENKIAESPPLDGNAWQPDKPLERGRIYTWQIEIFGAATTPNVVPTAKFRISSFAEEQKLSQALQSPSMLVRVTAFAEAGLLTAAERELELRRQNPRSAAIQMLLKQIRAARLRLPAVAK